METVQISHDAFARHAIRRELIRWQGGCSWCGQNWKGRLFAYYVERDDRPGRLERIKGLFCSIGCMRTYHRQ